MSGTLEDLLGFSLELTTHIVFYFRIAVTALNNNLSIGHSCLHYRDTEYL